MDQSRLPREGGGCVTVSHDRRPLVSTSPSPVRNPVRMRLKGRNKALCALLSMLVGYSSLCEKRKKSKTVRMLQCLYNLCLLFVLSCTRVKKTSWFQDHPPALAVFKKMCSSKIFFFFFKWCVLLVPAFHRSYYRNESFFCVCVNWVLFVFSKGISILKGSARSCWSIVVKREWPCKSCKVENALLCSHHHSPIASGNLNSVLQPPFRMSS